MSELSDALHLVLQNETSHLANVIAIDLLIRDVIVPVIKGDTGKARRLLNPAERWNEKPGYKTNRAAAAYFLTEICLQNLIEKYESKDRAVTLDGYLRTCLDNMLRFGSKSESSSRSKTASRRIGEWLSTEEFKIREEGQFPWFIPASWPMTIPFFNSSFSELAATLPVFIAATDPVTTSACRSLVTTTFEHSESSHQRSHFMQILHLQNSLNPQFSELDSEHDVGRIAAQQLSALELEVVRDSLTRALHTLPSQDLRLLRRFLELVSPENNKKTDLCKQLAPEFDASWSTLNYRLEKRIFPLIKSACAEHESLPLHELKSILLDMLTTEEGVRS